jgi:hypothetical protein
VLDPPRLQQLFSWMPVQHAALPKQSVPVGRQTSAAKAALVRAARMVRNCMAVKSMGWMVRRW